MNQTKKILVYLGCIAFTALGIWLLTIGKPHHNLSTMDNKSCWHPLHHLLWWWRLVYGL